MAFLDKNHPRLSHACQCTLLSINRSSTYYSPIKNPNSACGLANEIREIWEKHPFYGYRRIQAQLKRQGVTINHKRVQRLMKELGFQAIYPKPKTSKRDLGNRTYPHLLKGVTLERAHQVFATDITYIKLPQGFVYLIAIIDIYSRYILSWRLSNSLSLPFCLEALQEALEQGIPDIFNTDQGSQFTSDEWIYTLVNWGVKPSHTGVGRCLDNIHCERFWRTLKYEDVYLYGYETMAEARHRIGKFITFYNHHRPHQSLHYQTPGERYHASLAKCALQRGMGTSLDLKVELPIPLALSLTQNQRSQISLM